MTDREAMQQALDALENCRLVFHEDEEIQIAINALRSRMEQPEQGPVAESEDALKSIKLPCAVKIGHGTHGKGTSVYSLVVRARALYQMALDYSASQQSELHRLRGVTQQPDILHTTPPAAQQEYERGVIDGRQMQAKSSVDKAVNAMSQRQCEDDK